MRRAPLTEAVRATNSMHELALRPAPRRLRSGRELRGDGGVAPALAPRALDPDRAVDERYGALFRSAEQHDSSAFRKAQVRLSQRADRDLSPRLIEARGLRERFKFPGAIGIGEEIHGHVFEGAQDGCNTHGGTSGQEVPQ